CRASPRARGRTGCRAPRELGSALTVPQRGVTPVTPSCGTVIPTPRVTSTSFQRAERREQRRIAGCEPRPCDEHLDAELAICKTVRAKSCALHLRGECSGVGARAGLGVEAHEHARAARWRLFETFCVSGG